MDFQLRKTSQETITKESERWLFLINRPQIEDEKQTPETSWLIRLRSTFVWTSNITDDLVISKNNDSPRFTHYFIKSVPWASSFLRWLSKHRYYSQTLEELIALWNYSPLGINLFRFRDKLAFRQPCVFSIKLTDSKASKHLISCGDYSGPLWSIAKGCLTIVISHIPWGNAFQPQCEMP